MDPLSIVGTALSIGNGVSKAIRTLTDLKSRCQNAPLQLTTLTGQLLIVQASLGHLKTQSSDEVLLSDPSNQHLTVQIATSLDYFGPVIAALQ